MMHKLTLNNVSKAFNGVPALNDVSITLLSGRTHALMGENGAGKSTLIKLLAGVINADSMSIFRDKEPVRITNTIDATSAGFRFIHQELNLVPEISIAENILLSKHLPTLFGIKIDWAKVYLRAELALEFLGVTHINVKSQAGVLTSGDKMLVMIASAFVAEQEASPYLYVFDEPTAALTDQESEMLFSAMTKLKEKGAALLYVSHRIDEIMKVCDDISILRDGVLVKSTEIKNLKKAEIIKFMTGRELKDSYPPRTASMSSKNTISLRNIETDYLTGINFDLKAGEILGVTGLAGSGQSSLLKLLVGVGKALSGDATVLENSLAKSPHEAWSKGIAFIPRERRSEGLCLEMNVRENVVLSHLKSYGFHAKPKLEQSDVEMLAGQVKVKYNGSHQPVFELSGGNQQKVLFARALKGEPELLLLDEPTRGVDIGAKYEIYTLVRELSDNGCSIIISSSDLPEILGMCDRILILSDGRQTGLLEKCNLTSGDLLTNIYSSDLR